MDKVNVKKKFELFNQYWTPKILGELNGNYIKVFKAKGEFVWHQHENEDEFFLVIEGQLKIKLKDREIVLNEGEFFIQGTRENSVLKDRDESRLSFRRLLTYS